MAVLFSSLFFFLAFGVPIGLCLTGSSLIHVLFFTDYPATIIGQNFLFFLHKYSLLSVPFFVTAGFIMGHTDLIEKLFRFFHELLKWVPGGLGAATMMTAVVFAAFTGSSLAEASTLGLIAFPIMKKHGYPDSLSTAIITMGGTLGILIPPSWPLILYGVIADESISKLFIAGIVPGIILGGLLTVVIIIQAKRLGLATEKSEWSRIFKAFPASIPGLLMPAIVLGGLYGGIFAPTEAGAVACAYGLAYGIIFDRVRFMKNLPEIMTQSLRVTAMCFFLLGGVGLFNGILANEYVPQKVTQYVIGLGLGHIHFLVVYMVMLMILGCFVDAGGMIGLTVPVVLPTMVAMKVDPVALGILIVMNCELGAVTPPIGATLYGVTGVTGVPLETILKGVVPFFIIVMMMLFFLILFPGVSTWLPNKMFTPLFGV
jgi:C4-dicarboxylate transporter DctM subunit